MRWLYPLVLSLWSLMGFLTGFADAGSLLWCRALLGLFESGHWPCALRTTQALLAPADRALGNSILQSGTAIGAIVTPLIVAAMLTPQPGSWRRPFFWIGGIGLLWVVAWLWTMRGHDLSAPAPAERREDASIGSLLADHRFWLLALVVSCINGTIALYRVWLPLALQDKSGLAFSESEVLSRILPVYYLINDAGCLAAGAATVWLHSRAGQSVLNARRWVFTVCALLIVPSALLPALARAEMSGTAMLVLLMTAAGTLGVFPCYYSLTQELSREHMGLVTGLLSFFAWIVPSSLQQPLGAHIDRTGSYDIAFQVGAWPVLVSAIVLWLFWDLAWLRARRA